MAQEIIEVPITGKIISIDTKVGDEVQERHAICYIESMKMENPILVPVNGKITDIQVAVDEVVETGKVIAIIEY